MNKNAYTLVLLKRNCDAGEWVKVQKSDGLDYHRGYMQERNAGFVCLARSAFASLFSLFI